MQRGHFRYVSPSYLFMQIDADKVWKRAFHKHVYPLDIWKTCTNSVHLRFTSLIEGFRFLRPTKTTSWLQAGADNPFKKSNSCSCDQGIWEGVRWMGYATTSNIPRVVARGFIRGCLVCNPSHSGSISRFTTVVLVLENQMHIMAYGVEMCTLHAGYCSIEQCGSYKVTIFW